MTIAIVGGGAFGVMVAHDLAVRGEDVVLFEKGEIPNEDASTGRAAGVLYDAFAAPEDARIGKRAMERFREFSGTGGFEFVETPYVWFASKSDDERAEAIREQVPRMQAQGRDVSFLDTEELAERYPALNTDDVGVAAIARNAGRTDPGSYATAMAEQAEQAGAELRTEVEASVRTSPLRILTADRTDGADGEEELDGDEELDAVVVAAGAHTKRVLTDAGIPVPLKPYRVQALTCEFEGDVPMVYDATGGYYLRPHSEGVLAGDGTEEVESDPDEWTRDGDAAFCETMQTRLAHRLDFDLLPGSDPNPGPKIERAWAGLCTATPDYDPLLGELRPGLYVAAGWQGHGFMRVPALAEALAKDILGEGGIPEFDPRRFDGDEEFDIVEGMGVE